MSNTNTQTDIKKRIDLVRAFLGKIESAGKTVHAAYAAILNKKDTPIRTLWEQIATIPVPSINGDTSDLIRIPKSMDEFKKFTVDSGYGYSLFKNIQEKLTEGSPEWFSKAESLANDIDSIVGAIVNATFVSGHTSNFVADNKNFIRTLIQDSKSNSGFAKELKDFNGTYRDGEVFSYALLAYLFSKEKGLTKTDIGYSRRIDIEALTNNLLGKVSGEQGSSTPEQVEYLKSEAQKTIASNEFISLARRRIFGGDSAMLEFCKKFNVDLGDNFDEELNRRKKVPESIKKEAESLFGDHYTLLKAFSEGDEKTISVMRDFLDTYYGNTTIDGVDLNKAKEAFDSLQSKKTELGEVTVDSLISRASEWESYKKALDTSKDKAPANKVEEYALGLAFEDHYNNDRSDIHDLPDDLAMMLIGKSARKAQKLIDELIEQKHWLDFTQSSGSDADSINIGKVAAAYKEDPKLSPEIAIEEVCKKIGTSDFYKSSKKISEILSKHYDGDSAPSFDDIRNSLSSNVLKNKDIENLLLGKSGAISPNQLHKLFVVLNDLSIPGSVKVQVSNLVKYLQVRSGFAGDEESLEKLNKDAENVGINDIRSYSGAARVHGALSAAGNLSGDDLKHFTGTKVDFKFGDKTYKVSQRGLIKLQRAVENRIPPKDGEADPIVEGLVAEDDARCLNIENDITHRAPNTFKHGFGGGTPEANKALRNIYSRGVPNEKKSIEAVNSVSKKIKNGEDLTDSDRATIIGISDRMNKSIKASNGYSFTKNHYKNEATDLISGGHVSGRAAAIKGVNLADGTVSRMEANPDVEKFVRDWAARSSELSEHLGDSGVGGEFSLNAIAGSIKNSERIFNENVEKELSKHNITDLKLEADKLRSRIDTLLSDKSGDLHEALANRHALFVEMGELVDNANELLSKVLEFEDSVKNPISKKAAVNFDDNGEIVSTDSSVDTDSTGFSEVDQDEFGDFDKAFQDHHESRTKELELKPSGADNAFALSKGNPVPKSAEILLGNIGLLSDLTEKAENLKKETDDIDESSPGSSILKVLKDIASRTELPFMPDSLHGSIAEVCSDKKFTKALLEDNTIDSNRVKELAIDLIDLANGSAAVYLDAINSAKALVQDRGSFGVSEFLTKSAEYSSEIQSIVRGGKLNSKEYESFESWANRTLALLFKREKSGWIDKTTMSSNMRLRHRNTFGNTEESKGKTMPDSMRNSLLAFVSNVMFRDDVTGGSLEVLREALSRKEAGTAFLNFAIANVELSSKDKQAFNDILNGSKSKETEKHSFSWESIYRTAEKSPKGSVINDLFSTDKKTSIPLLVDYKLGGRVENKDIASQARDLVRVSRDRHLDHDTKKAVAGFKHAMSDNIVKLMVGFKYLSDKEDMSEEDVNLSSDLNNKVAILRKAIEEFKNDKAYEQHSNIGFDGVTLSDIFNSYELYNNSFGSSIGDDLKTVFYAHAIFKSGIKKFEGVGEMQIKNLDEAYRDLERKADEIARTPEGRDIIGYGRKDIIAKENEYMGKIKDSTTQILDNLSKNLQSYVNEVDVVKKRSLELLKKISSKVEESDQHYVEELSSRISRFTGDVSVAKMIQNESVKVNTVLTDSKTELSYIIKSFGSIGSDAKVKLISRDIKKLSKENFSRTPDYEQLKRIVEKLFDSGPVETADTKLKWDADTNKDAFGEPGHERAFTQTKLYLKTVSLAKKALKRLDSLGDLGDDNIRLHELRNSILGISQGLDTATPTSSSVFVKNLEDMAAASTKAVVNSMESLKDGIRISKNLESALKVTMSKMERITSLYNLHAGKDSEKGALAYNSYMNNFRSMYVSRVVTDSVKLIRGRLSRYRGDADKLCHLLSSELRKMGVDVKLPAYFTQMNEMRDHAKGVRAMLNRVTNNNGTLRKILESKHLKPIENRIDDFIASGESGKNSAYMSLVRITSSVVSFSEIVTEMTKALESEANNEGPINHVSEVFESKIAQARSEVLRQCLEQFSDGNDIHLASKLCPGIKTAVKEVVGKIAESSDTNGTVSALKNFINSVRSGTTQEHVPVDEMAQELSKNGVSAGDTEKLKEVTNMLFNGANHTTQGTGVETGPATTAIVL